MSCIKFVSNLILIVILNSNTVDVFAVDYFKYEPRQAKITEGTGQLSMPEKRSLVTYNLKCPKLEYIHPCDCLELDKRIDSESEGSGGFDSDSSTTNTPTVELPIEENIHPDLIETVAFCKNIRNVQVLTDAIKGFQGHRINYFVLDGCKLPPFPNSIFNGVNILWMEILNSTLQFHENYFNSKPCP